MNAEERSDNSGRIWESAMRKIGEDHLAKADPMTQPHYIDREAVARIIDPAAFMFSPGELADKVYSASRAHAFDRADRILALIAAPMEAVAALSSRPVDDTGGGFSSVNPAGPEAAALIERLTAERDEAQAENARWLLRMEAIREASGVGVLPMLSDLPDAIAAKMADHIGDADHMIAPLPELSGNLGGLREKVAEAINRAMIDGQGDQDIIRLATDDILAIPEIAALQAGEGR